MQFLDHVDESERRSLIVALGNSGCESAIEPLIHHLSDKDPMIREGAVLVLAYFRTTRVIEAIIERLDDEEVSASAQRAFIIQDSKRAFGFWSSRLEDERREIRVKSIRALGRFHSKAFSEKAAWLLISFLEDQDVYVRFQGVYELGNLYAENAVSPLIERLKDTDEKIRHAAIMTLGRIGSKDAIEALVGLLNDDNKEIRIWAIRWLKESACRSPETISSMNLVQTLIGFSGIDDQKSRSAIAFILGRIGSADAIETLLRFLKDQDIDVQSYALLALGEIGSVEVVDSLVEMLKSENSQVRSSGVQALTQIGSPRAISAALKMIEDKNEEVRLQALSSLEQIQPQKAIRILCRLIKQPKYRGSLYRFFFLLRDISNISSIKITQELVESYQQEDN